MPRFVFGTFGPDVLMGGAKGDVIFGFFGEDGLNGKGGNDLIFGGFGNDDLNGAAGHDTLFGGAGNDMLEGGKGNDKLKGGGGNDVIVAGLGNDTVNGGSGHDTLVMSGSETDYSVEMAPNGRMVLTNLTTNDITVARNVEAVTFQGPSAIPPEEAGSDDPEFVVGSTSAEEVSSGGGNDTVDAGGGDDTVNAGAGDDSVLGGDGSDRIEYNSGDGSDVIDGGADDDLLAITLTEDDGPISITSESLATSLEVTIGTESLSVSGVEEISVDLSAITDATVIISGDFASSGLAPNTVAVLLGDGDDLFNASDVTSDNRVVVFANDGADTLTGGVAGDVFDAGGGTDSVNGGLGDDIIFGGTGDDRLIGDSDVGNGGADILLGGDGQDELSGGKGNDQLIGGVGNDTMSGNADADQFIFGHSLDINGDGDCSDPEDLTVLNFGDDIIADFDEDNGDEILFGSGVQLLDAIIEPNGSDVTIISTTGTVSVIGLVDELGIPADPFLPSGFVLDFLLDADKGIVKIVDTCFVLPENDPQFDGLDWI